jgi:site-specific DNA recombinase
MKAVAYIRVSTSKQDLGPEAQRALIDAWATREGYTIVATFEERLSGGCDLDQREALLDAVAALEPGMVLVVAKNDRLARDRDIAGAIRYMVRRKGARAVSADSNGNGNDPYAAALDGMLEVFAQLERAMIQLRIREAFRVKRARGEKLGGHRPYGKAVIEQEGAKVLVIDPAERKLVARIKRMHRSGLAVRTIAAKLAAEGITTRSGRPMTKSTVHNLLHS